MPVYLLEDDELWFPDPYDGESSGLVAVGGDLSTERLILAYSNGFFPWFSFKSDPMPHWYCPISRFVIFPEEIHISHSMRNLINKDTYVCTFDEAFGDVIRGCSHVDNRIDHPCAWLGERMIEAYTKLHSLGIAHSVEVWEKTDTPGAERKLAGGLYGVNIGNGFMGESMFSLVPSASKLALIFLAKIALEKGWAFIDCQFETPHLKSMGGRHIPYSRYMSILHRLS